MGDNEQPLVGGALSLFSLVKTLLGGSPSCPPSDRLGGEGTPPKLHWWPPEMGVDVRPQSPLRQPPFFARLWALLTHAGPRIFLGIQVVLV